MVDLNLRNFFLIGVMVVIFILLFKVVFTKWKVKGVSEVFQAV